MIGELRAAVGAAHVEVRDEDRLAGDGARLSVRPRLASEVAEVLKLACAAGRAVGVGQGDAPIRLDLSRMTEVLHLDETSLLVHVQAGLELGALHQRLAAHGLALEPLPRPSRRRTVGAALAAPRPSEASPRGRLLDACAALDAVLADGTVVHTRLAPRRATGPDLAHALLSARGTTGVIVAAWLRCVRQPNARRFVGWVFDGGAAAITAARGLAGSGVRPADLAIATAERAARVTRAMAANVAIAANEVLLALRLDGVAEVVEAEAEIAREVAMAGRGRALSATLTEAWLAEAHRSGAETFVPSHELEAEWAACQGHEIVGFTAGGAALLAERAPAAKVDGLAKVRDELLGRLDPMRLFARRAASSVGS